MRAMCYRQEWLVGGFVIHERVPNLSAYVWEGCFSDAWSACFLSLQVHLEVNARLGFRGWLQMAVEGRFLAPSSASGASGPCGCKRRQAPDSNSGGSGES